MEIHNALRQVWKGSAWLIQCRFRGNQPAQERHILTDDSFLAGYIKRMHILLSLNGNVTVDTGFKHTIKNPLDIQIAFGDWCSVPAVFPAWRSLLFAQLGRIFDVFGMKIANMRCKGFRQLVDLFPK